MTMTLPESILEIQRLCDRIAADVLIPSAEMVDRNCDWPAQAFSALAEARLMGLHIPRKFGGREQGLLALAVATDALARGCSSSAMCYAMHCVGSAVIAAKSTAYHDENFLKPIAAGKHITTLALSEPGTGAHFYLPETQLVRTGEHYAINGEKKFVTNGGHANSYVVSTLAAHSQNPDAGEFSCVLLDENSSGIEWQDVWHGLGMRGNSSRSLKLADARVPAANLLGAEGDQTWFIFEIVAPYFLIAMSGVYLGIAQAALDLTLAHVKGRHHSHSGESLADAPVVQSKLAEMWVMVERTRQLIYHAASGADSGDPEYVIKLCAAKIEAADTAVEITNRAMSLCGGIAYSENSTLARLLRDARASHVMSPTSDILKLWAGRAILGLPML